MSRSQTRTAASASRSTKALSTSCTISVAIRAISGSSDSGSILPTSLEQRHALGDILGIVADPLDHAGDLQRGDDVAQVAGHRRAQRDQLDGAPLGLDLERVELLVVLDDLGGAVEVALHQAAHRLADRMFGQAAHLADERAQPVEVLVERLDRMSAAGGHVAFSDQP